jgi:hypothetical protein
MKLPQNQILYEKLRALDIDIEQGNLKDQWTTLLDGHSLHKLLYSL